MTTAIKKQFKTAAEVFVTKEYHIFKTIEGNRPVKPLHVEKLAKSMLERQLAVPIIVNENFEIIDGQHRFAAISKNGLPLYFIVRKGYNLSDVQRLNGNTENWNLSDFLEGYIELKKSDYLTVRYFTDKWRVPIGLAIELLSSKTNRKDSTRDFKEGNYKVDNLKKCELMMERIQDFSFFENYKTTTFIRAFQRFSASKKYSHDVMKNKIAYKSDILAPRNKIDLYLDLLSAMYNYKQNPANKIWFDGTAEI